jgi:hypothetical protein
VEQGLDVDRHGLVAAGDDVLEVHVRGVQRVQQRQQRAVAAVEAVGGRVVGQWPAGHELDPAVAVAGQGGRCAQAEVGHDGVEPADGGAEPLVGAEVAGLVDEPFAAGEGQCGHGAAVAVGVAQAGVDLGEPAGVGAAQQGGDDVVAVGGEADEQLGERVAAGGAGQSEQPGQHRVGDTQTRERGGLGQLCREVGGAGGVPGGQPGVELVDECPGRDAHEEPGQPVGERGRDGGQVHLVADVAAGVVVGHLTGDPVHGAGDERAQRHRERGTPVTCVDVLWRGGADGLGDGVGPGRPPDPGGEYGSRFGEHPQQHGLVDTVRGEPLAEPRAERGPPAG